VPELADTTAWSVRARTAKLRDEFDAKLENGEIATCDMVKLELLHSARNPVEFRSLRDELEAVPNCGIGVGEWRRALDVYEQLCASGPGNDFHRSVGHADLLIAAAAEGAGVTLLHYDQDFDAIAGVTGQPTRWIARKGSLR
jgi:predicted nucleic acid-binding protein